MCKNMCYFALRTRSDPQRVTLYLLHHRDSSRPTPPGFFVFLKGKTTIAYYRRTHFRLDKDRNKNGFSEQAVFVKLTIRINTKTKRDFPHNFLERTHRTNHTHHHKKITTTYTIFNQRTSTAQKRQADSK
eukprot:GEMP01088924.1.p2 GENE.GEMP01088924.1~~GEMP01088924.1.p2  ORF type:complete len:130 (-),score=10.09 GEMP01088924.1:119-508(-)